MSDHAHLVRVVISFAALSCTTPAEAQIDQQRATQYFKEAASLCAREGGRLWGISLCGPIVGDPVTHGIATSHPAPDAKPPAALGFANAAMDWGSERWVTLVWQMIPGDERARARLMLHELFHRIQPQLGFVVREGSNDHLDTLDGRYWMQLEWRALAGALGVSGSARAAAVGDALAFRIARRTTFPDTAENERRLEMNEGSRNTPGQSLLSCQARRQRPTRSTYSRRQHSRPRSYAPSPVRRERRTELRVAELRRRFVEGPVIVLPPGRNASFVTSGMTPIPGAGTSTFRTTAEWGNLEAASVLMSADRTLKLTAPTNTEGTTLKGDGWTLQLALGWVVRPGSRPGDVQVVRDPGPR